MSFSVDRNTGAGGRKVDDGRIVTTGAGLGSQRRHARDRDRDGRQRPRGHRLHPGRRNISRSAYIIQNSILGQTFLSVRR